MVRIVWYGQNIAWVMLRKQQCRRSRARLRNQGISPSWLITILDREDGHLAWDVSDVGDLGVKGGELQWHRLARTPIMPMPFEQRYTQKPATGGQLSYHVCALLVEDRITCPHKTYLSEPPPSNEEEQPQGAGGRHLTV